MIRTSLHDSVNRPGRAKWRIFKGYEIGDSLLLLKDWLCGAMRRDDRRSMIGGGYTSEHVHARSEGRRRGLHGGMERLEVGENWIGYSEVQLDKVGLFSVPRVIHMRELE